MAVSNVQKLIFHKMSVDMIPAGSGNPLGVGIAALLDNKRRTQAFINAQKWVAEAIAVVKTAPDNPWGNDDEKIEGAILDKLRTKLATKFPTKQQPRQ